MLNMANMKHQEEIAAASTNETAFMMYDLMYTQYWNQVP